MSQAVASGIAALLAVLLLAVTALSVCQSFHRLLHADSGANHHLCLMCALAKGHVSAADAEVGLVALTLACLCGLLLANTAPLWRMEHRLSPSRAPPSF